MNEVFFGAKNEKAWDKRFGRQGDSKRWVFCIPIQKSEKVQGGPLPAINGVIIPTNGLING